MNIIHFWLASLLRSTDLHVVLPLMAMMQVEFLTFSRELNGLTRTATFTDPADILLKIDASYLARSRGS